MMPHILLFVSFQVITTEQGQELADEFGIKFVETSAKSDINVTDAFLSIASDVQ